MIAERVSFGYSEDLPVLHDVSFTLHPASLTILSGRNGSGKSTLLRLLSGLLSPSDGTIRLNGRDIHALPPPERARSVGVAFQFAEDQLTERTVAREIALGLRALGIPEFDRRTSESLSAFGMSDFADRHPYDLEPAQRKLLTIACALSSPAQWILLDEPFSGLSRAEINWALVTLRAAKQDGRSIMLVAHDPTIVMSEADRLVVIHEGKIALDRTKLEGFSYEHITATTAMPMPASLRLRMMREKELKAGG